MPFPPRLKYVFMIVYIFLHLMTFDLNLLALIMLFLNEFGQHATTERGHVPCGYFVQHLQQNALKYGFHDCLHILALGDL